jgi:hypothetical protein
MNVGVGNGSQENEVRYCPRGTCEIFGSELWKPSAAAGTAEFQPIMARLQKCGVDGAKWTDQGVSFSAYTLAS